MPAQWQPQQAVILTWPHSQSGFSDNLYQIQMLYYQLASLISQEQEVWINASDESYTSLKNFYNTNTKVRIFNIASNDAWARDHAPISLYVNGKLELQNFHFNGWGNKFVHDLDNQINTKMESLNAFGEIPLKSHNLVLEGGSIESDGQGTLLTTKACLLNKNRNPHLTQAQIEQTLKQTLGFKRILWLEHGHLEGDDTDAHIDTLARFITSNHIVYCQARSEDEHYQSLKNMQSELKELKQENDQPYKLTALPLPSAIYNDEGQRLPATYANFLFINQRLLVPIYGVKEDKQALSLFKQALPERIIEPVNCREAIEQFGSLHCLTMQVHTDLSNF